MAAFIRDKKITIAFNLMTYLTYISLSFVNYTLFYSHGIRNSECKRIFWYLVTINSIDSSTNT